MHPIDDLIATRLRESIEAKQRLQDGPGTAVIRDMAIAVVDSLRAGGKTLFAGNGGSYADSIHLAGEFVSRFTMEREPIAGLALGANNSIMSAVGNDYSFNDVFLREVKALGRPGDVFVAISTSGNSPNIVTAVKVALGMGIAVFGMTGEKPCALDDLCPCLKAPSAVTARIQECHITAGHILCELVERLLFDATFDDGASAQ